MATYSNTTFETLKIALSSRLSDPARIHFVDTEIGLYIKEALRTFGLLSGFWRARGTVALTANTAFYDLTTELPALLASTVTDRDIIRDMQYSLLESASVQDSWVGTSMFTYTDITGAVQRRLNQFLSDTGVFLSRTSQPIVGVGRQVLDDTVIDARRLAFRSSQGYYSQVWREDEFAMDSGSVNWVTESGTPKTWSVMAPPPLEIQLEPIPSVSGTLDLIVVRTGNALDPATVATPLGIPDDLSPAIKWGALADVLGKDGPAFDPARAEFCEARYQHFVQLAKLLSCIVQAQIQGQAITTPSALTELDFAYPGWQSTAGTPHYSAIEGWNLIAVSPVPRGTSSMQVDVVRNSIVPASNGAYVQVGREQLDTIIDYAEHLAMFKSGGQEFNSTSRQAENFLIQSIAYNRRLSASARYILTPKGFSTRELSITPRIKESDGLGALPETSRDPGPNRQRVPVRL